MGTEQLIRRSWLYVRGPILALALLAAAWVWTRYLPMPPTTVTMAAGREDGVYHAWARRYTELLGARGVTVRVLATEGAMQNLQLLTDDARGADVGFLQGGINQTPLARSAGRSIVTLGRIDPEPVWLFTRSPRLERLHDLQGMRVSLGAPGSGTRELSLALLEQVRLQPSDLTDLALPTSQGVEALRTGEIDALVAVLAPQSPMIANLLRTPGVRLVQLRGTAALTERLPHLQVRVLSRGALDAATPLPAQDTALLLTSAKIVARADLHPALQRQFADVARAVHGRAGPFQHAGELPVLRRLEWPASNQARDVYAGGLPWLERQLPFWWAQLATRVLLIVLPALLLGLWLGRLAHRCLHWRAHSRVTRWYGELMYIEHELQRDGVTGIDLSRHAARLKAIREHMVLTPMPPQLEERWMSLLEHIDFVRVRLHRLRGR